MGIYKDKSLSIAAVELRRHAEELLRAKTAEKHPPRTMEETQRLFHELEVHQVELEMQNAELRQVRNKVETTLEKYSDLFDFAPVGYLTLDREGVIRAVNFSGASILGVEYSRSIGRRFGLFVADSARLLFADFLGRVFASQGKESCEVTLTREGASPLIAQIEALVGKSGQECRVAVIDITERKRAEEEIVRLNSDLAARAAELEAANIELDAFNYTVSHDLRRPLSVINSYCQVVLELYGSKLEEQCQEYIREIYKGTLRMNQLIEALLDFSRLAHAELNRDRVDLSSMAKELAEELKRTEAARRVELRIADGIVVNGDASLLRLVLANLLDNAWKYTATREEGVIDFGMTEVNGNQACFVRDNGIGFNMADSDKLFATFQRLPGSEECRGFGIGLSTVERIIKRHGGKVWAEGEPGKGATFYFTLQPSGSGPENQTPHGEKEA